MPSFVLIHHLGEKLTVCKLLAENFMCRIAVNYYYVSFCIHVSSHAVYIESHCSAIVTIRYLLLHMHRSTVISIF